MLLMLPLTCKGFNSVLLMYSNTLWLDAYIMLTVKPLRCISSLWLGQYVRYTPACNMLNIPQQNPLKHGFSGIEILVILYAQEAMHFHIDLNT